MRFGGKFFSLAGGVSLARRVGAEMSPVVAAMLDRLRNWRRVEFCIFGCFLV